MSLATGVLGNYIHTYGTSLDCFHCDKPLERDTPVEEHIWGIMAVCKSCGCMTPFEFEGRYTKKQQRNLGRVPQGVLF